MTTPAARVAPAGPSTAEASRTAGAVAARYGETMRGGTRLRTPRAARRAPARLAAVSQAAGNDGEQPKHVWLGWTPPAAPRREHPRGAPRSPTRRHPPRPVGIPRHPGCPVRRARHRAPDADAQTARGVRFAGVSRRLGCRCSTRRRARACSSGAGVRVHPQLLQPVSVTRNATRFPGSTRNDASNHSLTVSTPRRSQARLPAAAGRVRAASQGYRRGAQGVCAPEAGNHGCAGSPRAQVRKTSKPRNPRTPRAPSSLASPYVRPRARVSLTVSPFILATQGVHEPEGRRAHLRSGGPEGSPGGCPG